MIKKLYIPMIAVIFIIPISLTGITTKTFNRDPNCFLPLIAIEYNEHKFPNGVATYIGNYTNFSNGYLEFVAEINWIDGETSYVHPFEFGVAKFFNSTYIYNADYKREDILHAVKTNASEIYILIKKINKNTIEFMAIDSKDRVVMHDIITKGDTINYIKLTCFNEEYGHTTTTGILAKGKILTLFADHGWQANKNILTYRIFNSTKYKISIEDDSNFITFKLTKQHGG